MQAQAQAHAHAQAQVQAQAAAARGAMGYGTRPAATRGGACGGGGGGYAAAAAGPAAVVANLDLDDDALCVVCLTMPKSHAFIPCGHRCVCAACGNQILYGGPQGSAICPVCRTRANGAIKIFT